MSKEVNMNSRDLFVYIRNSGQTRKVNRRQELDGLS